MTDDYIYRDDAVSRISELLVSELHMTRCPTWNEVYKAIGELTSADVVQVEELKAEIYKLKHQSEEGFFRNHDYYVGYISALSTVEGILETMDGDQRTEYPDIGDEIMTQEGKAVIYSVRNGYVFYFNYNKTYNATGVDKAKNVIKTGRKFPDYKKSLERMRAEQE